MLEIPLIVVKNFIERVWRNPAGAFLVHLEMRALTNVEEVISVWQEEGSLPWLFRVVPWVLFFEFPPGAIRAQQPHQFLLDVLDFLGSNIALEPLGCKLLCQLVNGDGEGEVFAEDGPMLQLQQTSLIVKCI